LTILERITATVRERVASDAVRTPQAALLEKISGRKKRCDFALALRQPGLQVIAEFKRASPSAGQIAVHANPLAQTRNYAENGAAALSVLTERDYFNGSLNDLEVVAGDTMLPVLRKDFIIDAYQIIEAAAAGASAILLIAAILELQQLRDFIQRARQYGLAALVEVHNQAEMERALAGGAEIIGINNRNLHDFSISLQNSANLRPLIPATCLAVSESGIRQPEDFAFCRDLAFDAVLVGEAAMRQPHLLRAAR
jgi:indole-3-glycerol phosphate synthase